MKKSLCLIFLLLLSIPLTGEENCSKNVVCLSTYQNGSTVDFYVENLETFEVTVTIELPDFTNMKANVVLPYTNTYEGNKRIKAFSIWQDKKNKAWKYSYNYHWNFGSISASHDNSYQYTLPYQKDKAFKVLQGFNGTFSHFGDDKYAIDWDMPEGAPVYASRGGVVIGARDIYSKGGVDENLRDYSNYVMIKHSDGTVGEYDHFKRDGVTVIVGDKIDVGDLIGYSGNVGFSSGPHLHFVVYKAKDGYNRQSFPIQFKTKEGDGTTLIQGKTYSHYEEKTEINLVEEALTQAPSAEISEIKITKNFINKSKKGIRFDIIDVKVKGMYNKEIHFGFNITDGNDWIQWLSLEAKKVMYDPAYWETPAWFFYPYSLLEENTDEGDELTGYFYVVDTEKTEVIETKGITFKID